MPLLHNLVALACWGVAALGASIPMRQHDRIVVVGGGPVGVHYASLLAKKGFTNITILEAASQVGGKSRTEYDEDGNPQEMGTVFAMDTYTPIFDLVDEYDPSNAKFEFSFQKPGYMFAMGQTIGANDTETSATMDFPHFLIRSIQVNAPPALQPKATLHQLQALIFGVYPYGLPPQPKDWQRIDMSAMEFLTRHNLTALVRMFRFSQQQQGYGVLETIPAFYLLWWSHPDAVANIMKAQVESRPCTFELSKGFQSLWIAMASQHKRVVTTILGAKVTAVSRGLTELSASPRVTYTAATGNVVTIECDHVIMAVDLSVYANVVTDLTPDEAAVFCGTSTSSTFVTTIFDSAASPVETAAHIWPLRMRENGRLSALRNAKLTLATGVNPSKWGSLAMGRQVRVSYQFDEAPSNEVAPNHANDQLVHDLAMVHMTNATVRTQAVFNYFPRFSQERLKEGLPWKIWNTQGHRHTTWIGSSVSFESVLDVVTYNNNLIDRVVLA